MSEDTKSEVEKFWDVVSAKFGVHRKWHDLHTMEQMQCVQALNMIFSIMKD